MAELWVRMAADLIIVGMIRSTRGRLIMMRIKVDTTRVIRKELMVPQ